MGINMADSRCQIGCDVVDSVTRQLQEIVMHILANNSEGKPAWCETRIQHSYLMRIIMDRGSIRHDPDHLVHPFHWYRLGSPETPRLLESRRGYPVRHLSLTPNLGPHLHRNHPGYRTLLRQRSLLSILLPPIPGITPGRNHIFLNKHKCTSFLVVENFHVADLTDLAFEYYGWDIISLVTLTTTCNRAQLTLAQ